MTPETSLHCVDVEAVGKASQPEERRSSCFAVAVVHGVKVSVTHLLLKGAVDWTVDWTPGLAALSFPNWSLVAEESWEGKSQWNSPISSSPGQAPWWPWAGLPRLLWRESNQPWAGREEYGWDGVRETLSEGGVHPACPGPWHNQWHGAFWSWLVPELHPYQSPKLGQK